jgi:small multidrug resistance family-3 protein
MGKVILALAFLVGATTLEASGDAIVRKGLFDHAGSVRALVLLAGGVLLLGYGVLLNLAPLPFERLVGFYIATLFVVWQAIGFVAFRSVPSIPILIGGGLIVVGGLVVSFWEMGS